MQKSGTGSGEAAVANEPNSAQSVKPEANSSTHIKVSIGSELLEKARAATGIRDDRELVELALRTIIQLQAERELLKMQGTVEWEGNLDEMRADK